MAQHSEFKITGLKETLDVFRELAEQIGDAKAKSKILIPAVKMAMKPALSVAKSLAASNESGLLEKSLIITGRRPTSADKKSQYVSTTDSVVAFITTKPIPRAVKKKFHSWYYGNGNTQTDKITYRKAAREFYEGKGIFYDARAIANEFGTANRSAKPFLRPALEYKAKDVTELLRLTLAQKINQFKAKNIK